MLNDKVSDRERLLKLIDGGPEAMKEVEKKQAENLDRARAAAIVSFLKKKAAGIFGRLKPAGASPQASHRDFLLPGAIAALLVLSAAVYFIFIKHGAPSSSAEVVTHGTDKYLPVSEVTRLKLVGVDWSAEPVALIEDGRTGRTYFAKKNDTVNDARIKEILKDKVILQVHHQTLELKS